jgi:predicted nucleic acid-binding protein
VHFEIWLRASGSIRIVASSFSRDLRHFPQNGPPMPLLNQIWELPHSFTAYDAVHITLPEETNSVLYITDIKL